MSALTADAGNLVLRLVGSGVLDREDVAPDADPTVGGTRAALIFAASREHFNRPATLAELAEARRLLGLPLSSDDLRHMSLADARRALRSSSRPARSARKARS